MAFLMSMVIFVIVCSLVFRTHFSLETNSKNDHVYNSLDVPLVDSLLDAPLKAHLDISKLTKQLETLISYKVRKEVNHACAELIESLVVNKTKEAEDTLRRELYNTITSGESERTTQEVETSTAATSPDVTTTVISSTRPTTERTTQEVETSTAATTPDVTTTVISSAGPTTEPAKCINGWKEYTNHCYYFAYKAQTWHSAKKACDDRGAFLVKIDNTEENTWIKSVILKVILKRQDVWIGLNDQAEEGKYRWVSDNSDVGFHDWHENEPRNGTNRHCVQLWWYHEVYRWDDTDCNLKKWFICEKKNCVFLSRHQCSERQDRKELTVTEEILL